MDQQANTTASAVSGQLAPPPALPLLSTVIYSVPFAFRDDSSTSAASASAASLLGNTSDPHESNKSPSSSSSSSPSQSLPTAVELELALSADAGIVAAAQLLRDGRCVAFPTEVLFRAGRWGFRPSCR